MSSLSMSRAFARFFAAVNPHRKEIFISSEMKSAGVVDVELVTDRDDECRLDYVFANDVRLPGERVAEYIEGTSDGGLLDSIECFDAGVERLARLYLEKAEEGSSGHFDALCRFFFRGEIPAGTTTETLKALVERYKSDS